MKRQYLVLAVAGLLLASLCLWRSPGQVSVALADGGYDLSWWTVDGGGCTFGTSSGYLLAGTAGQPDAGWLEGGGYTLAGGFRPGGRPATPVERIYLPLVMRDG